MQYRCAQILYNLWLKFRNKLSTAYHLVRFYWFSIGNLSRFHFEYSIDRELYVLLNQITYRLKKSSDRNINGRF